MRNLAFLGLSMLLATGVAAAQQAEERSGEADEAQPARDPRPEIRVLHDPYELASFYRNENQGGFFATAEARHPIAGFYRGGMSRGGYSRFWTSGYDTRPYPVGITTPGAPYDSPPTLDYRSRIGENGDLFLLAPTFLAPVGPLADVFFSIEVR